MAARARHIAHAHTMAETMDVITSEMVFRNSKHHQSFGLPANSTPP